MSSAPETSSLQQGIQFLEWAGRRAPAAVRSHWGLGSRLLAQIFLGAEREVLTLVARGLTDDQIAEQLVLSRHTVHRHVANVRRKLGSTSRSAAVAEASDCVPRGETGGG